MQINSVTTSAVSAAVWNAASRTLTSLAGTGVLAIAGQGVIAAGATLDLRPSGSRARVVWFTIPTAAAGDFLQCGLYDGTTVHLATEIGGGGAGQVTMIGNSSLGPGVFSAAAVGVQYYYGGYDFA
ncbi:MAG: hypothetical protein RB191_24960 [Terriglobia bacterium]|nr:hypothetical protein [Terriglobia bacterium]